MAAAFTFDSCETTGKKGVRSALDSLLLLNESSSLGTFYIPYVNKKF